MPQVIYTLDNAIDSFFSEAGASSSKTQCDEVARQRGNKIIQFREQTALLDMDILARLEYVAGALPERFLPAVTEVQAALPALLDGCYPVVLRHSDLNEMKILVDPCSGKITGVADWPGASNQPFGFTLYALENALGSMGSNGWKWSDNVDNPRGAF
ncbi:hypothetical protein INS49_015715 [Diaporthe citri]|uniref:uncharacterized protein n=1 Tax=Diaporthe citri TaxID=83186 RepID=UPI001C819AED|nr:uncharacterized protein INS49_015715 [Diaporthe citri]KAG6356327.1 hypothetical protein INS49_015715 [Diaporthe citri]